MSVIYFSYLFYPILVLLPLTVILSIVVVDVVATRYLSGPLPSFFPLVDAQGSIPSLPQIHLEGSCVALSWKFWILFVPHLYPHWVCVFFFWYWGDIAILCGLHNIRMSSSRKGYCAFSLYCSNSLLGYPQVFVAAMEVLDPLFLVTHIIMYVSPLLIICLPPLVPTIIAPCCAAWASAAFGPLS